MTGKLTKKLTMVHIYAIAAGAMISSGLFVLPGIAASKTGPAVIFVYLLSGILLLPSLFAIAELSTAMPRAGGTYFFISRSLGGMFGTIDGVGVWLALILKTSIALIGLGAYAAPYVGLPMSAITVIFCIVFMLLNYFGAKEAAGLQVGMVFGMLTILALLIVKGIPEIDPQRLTPLTPFGARSILPTAAFLFISYIGLTNVASLSEEVKNPERNIPLSMIIALGSVMAIYGLVVWIVVGVVPESRLFTSLTPVSDAAGIAIGPFGAHLISIAAILAFATTANAGILSASRYLLAMSRDRVIPHTLSRFSRFHTPDNAIFLTSGIILIIVLFTHLEQIAKLASAFQLLEFGLVNLAIIVMHESGVQGYDPGFKSPLYPFMPILGILISVILIPQMGLLASIFSLGLIGLGVIWHSLYTRHHVTRIGAVAQMAQRVAESMLSRDATAMGLHEELREILKEKGLREGDPFKRLVDDAFVYEIRESEDSEDVLRHGAKVLGKAGGISGDLILGALLQRNRLGETPAEAGIALPHLLMDEVTDFHMVIARSIRGIHFPGANQSIHAVFILLGNRANPSRHLRFLAEIARRAENQHFIDQWIQAGSNETLKHLLLDENSEF